MDVNDDAGNLTPRGALRFYVGTPPGACSFLQGGMQVFFKPVASEPGDCLQRAWLFKKMRGALHDFQPLLAPQGLAALTIQAQHHRVLCTDNLQGRRLDPRQGRSSQIGSPTPTDHCPYHWRTLSGGHQCCRRAGTGAEQSAAPSTQFEVTSYPVAHIDQPPGQQRNIEAQLPAEIIQ